MIYTKGSNPLFFITYMNRAKPTTPIDKDYTYCYNVDSKAKEELIMKNFTIIDWNIEEMTGYKPMTTFYRDFSIRSEEHTSELQSR